MKNAPNVCRAETLTYDKQETQTIKDGQHNAVNVL